ncbi:MAG: hypothetical protein IIC02_07900 [Planctomycetes bacterium]|nr:hypothetical protein [Planctomycetota bacterium]
MKQGTLYAGRLKKAYAKFHQQTPAPETPAPTEPLHQLAIAAFAVSCGERPAAKLVDSLLSNMAGWNEVRVSRPAEINKAMGNADLGTLEPCQRLLSMLESVYERENALSLDRLKRMGRREARHYLDSLGGVDEYGVASVALWSLGGHGIPVSDGLLKELRAAALVHPDATRGEVQAFLERHISAADAQVFSIVMASYEASKGAMPKKAKKGTTKTKASSNKKDKTTVKKKKGK